MGKLTNMVAKESSLGNRVKYNARRIRFAGIGLFGKLDQERARLYQQIVEKGNGSSDDSVVAVLNAFGAGVVTLAREESLRIFDELVEAGEVISSTEPVTVTKVTAEKKTSPAVLKAVESTPAKAKPAKKAAALKAVTEKKATPEKATRKKKEELVAEEVLLAFGDAKERIKTLTNAPDQAAQLSLYALFKQGEDGDVTGRRPAMAKMVERAKFDSRRELKGMSKVEAIEKYIAKVAELAG
ncbi:MAG: acyl-CoA-binding protein [Pseudomonadales bacterium]|nr:acyl-CoA-binding protein [Pseudomonadales bacterium]